jgi:hypothetical protein
LAHFAPYTPPKNNLEWSTNLPKMYRLDRMGAMYKKTKAHFRPLIYSEFTKN